MAIIEVNHVSKEFQLGQLQGIVQTVQGMFAIGARQNPAGRRFLKALDDVDFKIDAGEVVGIIGENGAGKSTLLKLLSRISKPTTGEIKIHGKVAPLIEVGAGLNPELTGRENIYLNATILGMPRRLITEKFDEIVEFAELEKFIDTPVKRYSSGMTVRLAFSIATSVEASILIVDEVLAVGDLAFQRKCFDRMEDLIKRQGRTVLLVSHNIRQVERICNRVILMDHGKILADGDPKEACELFYARSNSKVAENLAQAERTGRNVLKSGEIELESIHLLDQDNNVTDKVVMGGAVTIRGIFNSQRAVEKSEIVYGFHTTDFVYIASMGTAHIVERPDLVSGRNIIDCHMSNLPLVPGVYCIRASVIDKFRRPMFSAEMLATFTVTAGTEIVSKMPAWGVIYIPAQWEFCFTNGSEHPFQRKSNEMVD